MFLFTSAEPQIDINSVKGSIVSDNLATRIRANQQKLGAELKPHYDFIVCGSGSSGSVVARRLAENADVNVLLLEAGGSDDVAAEAGDDGWNYQSVLQIYRRIEDWHGAPDPARRGKGGLLFVQPAPDPHPLAAAMLDAFAAAGVPTFADQNGVMMEG